MTRGLVAASFLALGLAAGSLCAEPLSRAEAVSAALAANPGVRRSRAGVEQARASDLPRDEPVPAPVRSARTTAD